MTSQKRKIIALLASLLVLLLCSTAVSVNIIISHVIDKNALPGLVVNFCKNSLDRAVSFSNADLSLFGNINISMLNLSYGSDFNDNMSLIKAKDAICSMDFFKLLCGEVIINSITFNDAEVFLVKSYGKTYRESFSSFLSLPDTVQSLEHTSPEKLTVKFTNTTLIYREFFKEEHIEASLRDASVFLTRKGNTITYSLNGVIPSKESDTVCKISASEKNGRWYGRLHINNLDLSAANRHIKEYGSLNASVSGLLSATVEAKSDKNSAELSVSAKTKKFSIYDASHDFLSNANLSGEIVLSRDKEQGILEIKNLKLQDKNIDIALSAKKQDSESARNLSLSFRAGEMNMARISEYLRPFRNTLIAGRIHGSGSAFIDYNDDKRTDIKASVSVMDLTVIKNKRRIISEWNGEADLKNRRLSLSSSLATGDSDLKISLDSNIKHFIPFASDSDLKIHSKNLSALLAAKITAIGIDRALASAYKDANTGYHENFFLQRPVSAYINSSNMEAELTADRLFFRDKAALSGFKLNASLDRGVLSSKEFALTGYGGEYRLQLAGMFNRDYPVFQIKADASRINLDALAADIKAPYGFGGILDISCSYELKAYRMLHILQNGIGSLSVSLRDCSLKNTDFQKRLKSWLAMHGTDADIDSLDINSLNLQIVQYGSSFSFRNFSVMSDKAVLYGTGSYAWDTGINMPLSLAVKGSKTIKNENLLLSGPLLNSRLNLLNRKERGEQFNVLN